MLLLRAVVVIFFYELILVLSEEYEMQLTSWKPIEETFTVSNNHVPEINDPSETFNVFDSDPDKKPQSTNDSSESITKIPEIPLPDVLRNFFMLYDTKTKRESDENSEEINLENSEEINLENSEEINLENSESETKEDFEKTTSDIGNSDYISEDQTVENEESFTIDRVADEVDPEIDSGEESKENNSFGDDSVQLKFYEPSQLNDLSVRYGTSCDRVKNGTCWNEQTVGETITLGININNFNFDDSIEIQWTRMYHQPTKKHDLEVRIEPDRLPWNMVMGSGGLEIRLNPVTDGDLDPNALVAKVFLDIPKNGKREKKLIKRLEFRIEVSPIEFKRIYPGEELNINLEEYLSLPANGDLALDWRLEKPNGQVLPLPSNFKVSWSGRLVVVKEIRREHLGLLTCTVYSSNTIAVAKRRFLLKSGSKKSGRLRKRSTKQYRRHTFRGGCLQDAKAARMMEYYRIKSRKKRLKSGSSLLRKGGCRNAPYRKRLHPRWIPFHFFEDDADLDSRLMPIEKLIDLSEKSDGTLDDEIPHETHYVDPMATVISDDFTAPSAQANCSKDTDCGTGAICVRPKWKRLAYENAEGFCYCKPEYFGDGFECTKIPRITREKRIKRSSQKEAMQIQPKEFNFLEKLFTDRGKISAVEKKSIKDMEYEDEEAYLLSTCSNSQDCGQHATCMRSKDRHPFCKCKLGYRGNGIFCWEIMDYFPLSRISDTLTTN